MTLRDLCIRHGLLILRQHVQVFEVSNYSGSVTHRPIGGSGICGGGPLGTADALRAHRYGKSGNRWLRGGHGSFPEGEALHVWSTAGAGGPGGGGMLTLEGGFPTRIDVNPLVDPWNVLSCERTKATPQKRRSQGVWQIRSSRASRVPPPPSQEEIRQ